jgi:hypothetical protein
MPLQNIPVLLSISLFTCCDYYIIDNILIQSGVSILIDHIECVDGPTYWEILVRYDS